MREEIKKEYVITIRRLREVKKNKEMEKYTDKMFLVDIWEYWGKERLRGTGFAIDIKNDYGKALRKVFRTIQEELYLR